MTAVAVVVGVSLFIILVISAVVTLVWRKRNETPADRYRRDILGIQLANPKSQAPRWARNDWAPPQSPPPPGGGV